MTQKTRYLLGFLIIGMIAAAYFPALSIPLRGDDFEWLNSAYSGWREPASLLARINNFFRPVVKLSYLLDYSRAATRAPWYNITTLAIHLLNVWLLCALLERVSRWPVAGGGKRRLSVRRLVVLWRSDTLGDRQNGQPDAPVRVRKFPAA